MAPPLATKLQGAFRDRWALIDIGYIIGRMLVLARDHKLQNPKSILIPVIKSHIRDGSGESEMLLQGYDIDGIEEIREDGEIVGFGLPVTENGVIIHKLVYNLQSGGNFLEMSDGTKVYVRTEKYTTAFVKRLIAHPERKREILAGLTDAQKEEVMHRAVEALQSQIRQVPKVYFEDHIKNYVIRLKILAILGILDGIAVYPMMGIDVFPAQFCRTVGINSGNYIDYMFHEIEVTKPEVYNAAGVDPSIIRNSLIYEKDDILDINGIISHVNRNRISGEDHTALILKGVSWLKKYGFNPKWSLNAAETCREYLIPLCDKLLKAGDHIVAFNEDMEYCDWLIKTGEYEEVDLGIDKDILMSPDMKSLAQPVNDKGELSRDVFEVGADFIVLRKKPKILPQLTSGKGAALSEHVGIEAPLLSEDGKSDVGSTALSFEDKSQAESFPVIERGRVNNIDYKICWANPKGKVFREDRNPIRQKLIKFLEDPGRVEAVLKNIGSDITYKEIAVVNIQYLRASERIVFRIKLSLIDGVTNRTGFHVNRPIFEMAVKSARTSNMNQAEVFKGLKGMGFAPEFGELFDDIYYEEWIKGPTVHAGAKNGLNSEEIRKITATWMKVVRYLSNGNSYTQYPIDVNPSNIMYRNISKEPEFVVVDILERRPKYNNPALFIHSIVKFYIYGKGFGIKSIIPNDIKPILEGIYEGLGYDKAKTTTFLKDALNLCVNKLYDPMVRSAIEEFLVKLELDNTRPPTAAFAANGASVPDMFMKKYISIVKIFMHLGIVPVDSVEIMKTVYSPGVGEVCRLIEKDPSLEEELFGVTPKSFPVIHKEIRKIVIFSDGSAVLGMGTKGPHVMRAVSEGKRMLLKWFGGVDADIAFVDTKKLWKLYKKERDPKKRAFLAKKIEDKVFGSVKSYVERVKQKEGLKTVVMLEDIAAPVCFSLEERLNGSAIPTIHDDQHGTAIVFAGGLLRAARETGRENNIGAMKIVIAGAGSAGIATARLLHRLGFGIDLKNGGNIIMLDSKGALHSGRTDINGEKSEMAALNIQGFSGNNMEDILKGADAFIGLAEPGYLWGKEKVFEGMNKDSVVFLGANPKPEADPAVLKNMPNIRFIATGAFGYPQGSTFNNSYSFPAIFRALRDAPPTLENFDIMKIEESAAWAISRLPLSRDDLIAGRLLPPTFSEGKFNTAVFASIFQEVSHEIGSNVNVESVLRNIEGQHMRAYAALTESEREALAITAAPAPASPESESIHSTNFQDIINYIQAQPQSQPLIIALGTDWMRGYEKGKTQYNALNPLISSIRNYCESKGIPFIVDEDNNLPGRINTEKTRDGKSNAKVIVLAGKDTVKLPEFAPLRDDKNVVVGISKQEPATDEYIYIRLMEMLTLALKLSVGIETIPDNTPIKIVKDDKLHIYIFIPPAQPMDYEKLKAIYRVQEFA
ncbi:MAG: hypothetical protein NTY76_04480 [Candidatus Omnitrophica bacterium]|nr:hypothetical protein [Candidatus Omnitrophota bacterium]